MKCPWCGVQIAEGSKFCPECGHTLDPNATKNLKQAQKEIPKTKGNTFWENLAATGNVIQAIGKMGCALLIVLIFGALLLTLLF